MKSTRNIETPLVEYKVYARKADIDLVSEVKSGEIKLIPWDDSNNQMIDRYDLRAFYSDFSELEQSMKQSRVIFDNSMKEKMQKIERLSHVEGFKSLLGVNQLLKLSERVPSYDQTRVYQAVPYFYSEDCDDSTKNSNNLFQIAGYSDQPSSSDQTEEEKPFLLPSHLECLFERDASVNFPKSEKQFMAIDKTAQFCAKQGTQWEILLKTKQANNPKFDFLNFQNSLFPFYSTLLNFHKRNKELEETSNEPPISSLKDYNSRSSNEEEEESDTELHPLLISRPLSSNFAKPNERNSPNVVQNKSILISSKKSSLVYQYEDSEIDSSDDSVKTDSSTLPEISQAGKSNQTFDKSFKEFKVIPPPPDIKSTVDEFANHVVKQGIALENHAKKFSLSQYPFLLETHIYYPYYQVSKQRTFAQLGYHTTKVSVSEKSNHSSVDVESGDKNTQFISSERFLKHNFPVFISKSSQDSDSDTADVVLKRPRFSNAV